MIKNLEFKNLGQDSVDLYVYGAIVQEKEVDFWTGEKSQTDVDTLDFQKSLDQLQPGQILNIYVNSPGGDVFVTSAVCSQIERTKARGVKVNAYIDGVAASAASFLVMQADTITAYKNSMMMIHKPSCVSWGNADELAKDIETLNQIENNVMLPLYRSKAKCKDDEIASKIANETWLSADEMAGMFDITIADEEKQFAAIDRDMLLKYKNTPKELLAEKQPPTPQPKIDYTYFEKSLKEIKEK